MIDVSDGLIQDLGHICKASRIGAIVAEEQLPLSAAYCSLAGYDRGKLALTGGEDYELLFCARRRDRSRIENLKKQFDVPVSRIGRCVRASDGLTVLSRKGHRIIIQNTGHDHFKHRLMRGD
jgi:thiamine-monophosphate kinase